MRAELSFALLASGALFGCSGEDGGQKALGEPPQYPVPGCEKNDPSPCDVRTTPCQVRLLGLAACLRGEAPGELPPVSLMTESQYEAYLNEQLAMQDPAPNPNHYERALTLLGLVQPGALGQEESVAATVKFVWGTYRWQTKDITIVDHGMGLDDAQASAVLVHEFVHMLQDRDVDVAAFQGEHALSFDSFLASDAVIEGEARMHEARYAAAALGLNSADIDWNKQFQNTLEFDEKSLRGNPSPYAASWSTFPYQWGARYMHFTWASGGLDAVLRRFASPPATTLTLMASVDAALETELTPSSIEAPLAPSEFTLVTNAALGAWGTFLLLVRQTLDVARARTLALQWRGDGLWVYSGAASQPSGASQPSTAVVWRIDFADEASATEVAQLAMTALGVPSVRRQGTRVVFAKTTGVDTLDWAFAP